MRKQDNIPGYPGYFISRMGRIYCRKVRGSTKGSMGNWYKLKTQLNHGYPTVNLWDGRGNRKKFKIHRLVAITYIPNPNNLPVVCHKDNNKLHPYYKNLYWGTLLDNNLQCIRDGRGNKSHGKDHWSHKRRGENHPNSKLSSRSSLYEDYLTGKYTQIELASRYNISQGAVSKNINKYKKLKNI